MNVPYTRAPHQGGSLIAGADSPHAALLIDFDNVTMGMRSDLSKELKTLLDSDVIKGKVSVQRAYADWRRYPQYIVPLSEASVDLIFAPAYGSSKKNATDIRMAIDALELIFIRPEIGTYILLTGDSDFSSLVLKLKEYGKYVIGVGIQESSSDILVQNCDEYYSYTSLTGLTKTTELGRAGRDPWVLVRDAVAKMVKRGDVMRSDRLKQVMQELDPAFDEGGIGFSKFSKFLAEASSRGLVDLRKLENGQYEVGAGKGRGSSSEGGRARRGGGRGRGRGGRDRSASTETSSSTSSEDETGHAVDSGGESADAAVSQDDGADPLAAAYDALREALQSLKAAGRDPVRDSDVKRKILERQRSFDETELGFSKFSRFLAQAVEDGVVRIERTEAGNHDVTLLDRPEGGADPSAPDEAPRSHGPSETDEPEVQAAERQGHEDFGPDEPDDEVEFDDAEDGISATDPSEPTVIEVLPPEPGDGGLRLGPRRGSTRRRGGDDPPPFFEGQAAGPSSTSGAPASSSTSVASLGLPSDPGAIVRYLTHRYKGVGEKTAETLVEKLGSNLFATMQDDPDAISRIVPPSRAEQVLSAWRTDYERRVGLNASDSPDAESGGDGKSGSRRGGRGRGRGRGRS